MVSLAMLSHPWVRTEMAAPRARCATLSTGPAPSCRVPVCFSKLHLYSNLAETHVEASFHQHMGQHFCYGLASVGMPSWGMKSVQQKWLPAT